MSKTQNALARNIAKLTEKKPKTKVKRKTQSKEPEIKYTKSKDTKLFPYSIFIWRLEDRKENKVCHFECFEHAEKYIRRYKLEPIKQYRLQVKV
tara:strand:- start:411 stop:692 length:282 start_codon:yes stop_codon:yes gene_type:complete